VHFKVFQTILWIEKKISRYFYGTDGSNFLFVVNLLIF
jgi:hypothetical protein